MHHLLILIDINVNTSPFSVCWRKKGSRKIFQIEKLFQNGCVLRIDDPYASCLSAYSEESSVNKDFFLALIVMAVKLPLKIIQFKEVLSY